MQKAIAVIDIEQFNFSEYHLERFKILVGPRYRKEETRVKFACHMFPSYEANFEKVNEQIYEVWDCGVVWDFVKMRLAGSAVEHVTQLLCKDLHEICDYWLMEFVYFIFIINQSII